MHDGAVARLTGRVLAVLLLSLVLAAPAAAEPRLTPVGSFYQPVYVTAPPGDGSRLFVVEKPGLILLKVNGGAPKPFLDIRGEVDAFEEQGLLSMAFAPDYATSRRFYVYYNAPEAAFAPGSRIKIVEFKRSASDPDVADPASRREVITFPKPGISNHNGGQLQFGPDGLLYAATGDGGGVNDPNENGQNTSSLLGKLLRIDPRPGPGGEPYTVPAGNPFADGVAGEPEIWAYGLRNPWRFSFDRATGDLTLGDVGQREREEINFIARPGGAGANFGWDCYEGSVSTPDEEDCEPPGHVPPHFEYLSDSGFCSVTGGYVVRDPALPTLAGRYLYADFCAAQLRSLNLSDPVATDRAEPLTFPRAVTFGEDSCGRLYVATTDGPVSRIDDEPVTPCPVTSPPVVTEPDTDDDSDSAPNQPAPPPPPLPVGSDTTPPKLSLSRARAQRLLRREAIHLGVRCDEACGVTTKARARLRVGSSTKKWKFAALTRLVEPGERPRLKLKLTDAMRSGLAKRMARGERPLVTVLVTARDAAGNQTRNTAYVRVVG